MCWLPKRPDYQIMRPKGKGRPTVFSRVTALSASPGATCPGEEPVVREPTVTATRLDGVVIIALHGEHDLSTADELRRVFRAHVADAESRIVIDLTDATFIDSTVLNTILPSPKR